MKRKEILNITLVEQDIIWENPEANTRKLDHLLDGIQTDIIILPEMFSTGFSMNVEKIAEEPFGTTYRWMSKKSAELKSAICGSISTYENEKYYNRFYFVTPGGSVFIYDKKHLFSYGTEPKFYHAGDQISTIYYLGWKIRPIICYDLRFPVWIRNTDDYDLLICVANWPSARREVWQTLLKARAIENMVYTIGVNRIGTDGSNLEYRGDSAVIDPIGKELFSIYRKGEIQQFTIDQNELYKLRKKFRFLDDRDDFYLDY